MNDKDFWRLFGRVLGHPIEPARYTPAELPAWDSLRHVELVFELEEAFGIDIAQADIAALYSDTDTVRAYLREHASA